MCKGLDVVEKISSVHIADVMLREGKPVSAKEIMELIRRHYPRVKIDPDFVYARLSSFSLSKSVICRMDKTVRPRKYEMVHVTQSHFNRESRESINFDMTVIPKAVKRDEKKAARCTALLLSLTRPE